MIVSDVIKALQAIIITVKSQSEAINQLQDNINDVKIKFNNKYNNKENIYKSIIIFYFFSN